jgi:dienelactone hydrolase
VIAASFFESPKPGSPAVLLLHQWESNRHSFDDFAARMQAKGFNVLSIDGRGFGESTKTADGKTVAPERTDQAVKAMLGDVDAAINYLSKQKNVDPNRIGIVGASYGSSLAIIYAASHPAIRSVALISPGLNYFGNMQTEPAVKAYGERPLFMVAAEDDKESADAVRQLKATSGNDAYQAQTYQHGGHGTDIFKANVGLAENLEVFLTDSLQK